MSIIVARTNANIETLVETIVEAKVLKQMAFSGTQMRQCDLIPITKNNIIYSFLMEWLEQNKYIIITHTRK